MIQIKFSQVHPAYAERRSVVMLTENVKQRSGEMDNKKSMEEDTRGLTFIVVYLSIIVLILLSIGPMI